MTRRRLLFAVPREYGRAVSPRSTALAALAAALVLSPPRRLRRRPSTWATRPPRPRRSSNLRADVNAYFPARITIRRGDKVRFVPSGLHTLDLVRGKSPVGLVTGGAAHRRLRDPAGLPFWFNSQPDLELSAPLLNVAFGKSFTYDGSGEVQSGLPLVTKPLTVRFTKTGSFTYFCNVHPGMKGTVNVIGGRPPSAKVRLQGRQAADQRRREGRAQACRRRSCTTTRCRSATAAARRRGSSRCSRPR